MTYLFERILASDPSLDRLRSGLRALLGSGFLERAVPFAECVDTRFAEDAVAAAG